jgi:hypothetical protein
MGFLTSSRLAARQWSIQSSKAHELIIRAANIQAVQRGIDLEQEATRLARGYRLAQKPADWRDYGDIAFHLVAAYPPDLAYLLVYTISRLNLGRRVGRAPFMLKAIEQLYAVRPRRFTLQVTMSDDNALLWQDPVERARRAARVLVRELSTVPLRYASGAYHQINSATKPYVDEELASFNPAAAALLPKSKAWVFTPQALGRAFFRILFGQLDE